MIQAHGVDQTAFIHLQNIDKTFDSGTLALKNLSLGVQAGEFLSLLGPSGCGKSTTLRIIAGLTKATAGTIARDKTFQQTPGSIGFVFQDPTLMPWATVSGNVHLPLKLKGISKRKAHENIMQVLRLVGLEDFANAYPRELSGGMKMRVSIARALITKPTLLLMDEPFAALDEITRFKLNDKLLELWQHFKWTVVFVTHSVFEASYLSSRIAIMSERPGTIVDSITVPMAYPRKPELRSSEEYIHTCQAVSDTLQSAMKTST